MSGASWCTPSSQLSYGKVVPQPSLGQPAHWEYVDDFGLMAVVQGTTDRGRGSEGSELGALREELKRPLEARGIPVHNWV